MVCVGILLSPNANIWGSAHGARQLIMKHLQGTDPNCSVDICPGDVGWDKFTGLKRKFTFFFFFQEDQITSEH